MRWFAKSATACWRGLEGSVLPGCTESCAMIICLDRQLKRSPAIRTHLPAGWSAAQGAHDQQRFTPAAKIKNLLYIEVRHFVAPSLLYIAAVFCRRLHSDQSAAACEHATQRVGSWRATIRRPLSGLTRPKPDCHYGDCASPLVRATGLKQQGALKRFR